MSPSTRHHPAATRRDRGAVLPLVALFMAVLMASTAFAIDQGRQRSARRSLQADADVIALDAVSVIGGLDAITAEPLALIEANQSALRNDYDIEITDEMLEVGYWENNTFTPMTAATEFPNAVHVMLTNSVDAIFDFTRDQHFVRREAYAVEAFGDAPCGGLPCGPGNPLASSSTTSSSSTSSSSTSTSSTSTTSTTVPCTVDCDGSRKAARSRAEIGSVLASFQFYGEPSVDADFNEQVEATATILNNLFTEYLGIDSPVDLGAAVNGDPDPVTGPATGLRADAVSYKALALGYASLDDVAATMGFGNLSLLMGTTVTVKDFLDATVAVMSASGEDVDLAAATVLGDIAREVDLPLDMTLGNWLKASSGNEGLLATEISALDILHATATIVDGKNFISASLPLSLPLVGGDVLTRISVIEPPSTHRGFRRAGEEGPSTAQVKIALDIPLEGVDVDLRGIHPLFGTYLLGGTLPVVVEVAKAESIYGSMACPSEVDSSFTDFSVETSAVSISYGSALDADLQTAGDVPVQSEPILAGSIALLGSTLDFAEMTTVNQTITWNEGISYVGGQTSNAGFLGTFSEITHTAPYPSSWIRYPGGVTNVASGTYDLTPLNGTTDPVFTAFEAAIESAIDTALAPLFDQLDEAFIEPLLQSMGTTLAGADARMQNLKCKIRTLASVDET